VTAAVQRYRARQEKQGSITLYCTVSRPAALALDAIMLRRICSKREAVEYALQRYATDLTRKR
jgi:hypothetical protein